MAFLPKDQEETTLNRILMPDTDGEEMNERGTSMNRPALPAIVLLFCILLLCIACEDDCPCGEEDDCLDEDGDEPADGDDNTDGDEETDTVADGDAETESEAEEEPKPVLADVDFQLEEQFVLYDGNGKHLAFPDVERLSDGRLMVVFREGTTHVDTTGRVMKLFGQADGKTWDEEPTVLLDVSQMDDRDPSLARLPDGRLIVNYFQYKTFAFGDGSMSVHHIFTSLSDNNGASFGSLVQVDPGDMAPTEANLNGDRLWVDGNGEPFIIMASSSRVETVGERWIIPSYGANALNLSALASMPRSRIALYESTDEGQTWAEHPVMPDAQTDVWLMEPALLRLADGRLLLQVRTSEGNSPSNPGPLKQSISEDEGQTWSAWTDFPFVGHAPELLQLQNGAVLSAFRWLNDAYTAEDVSFIYSVDGAETWSERIQIENCGTSECGYPGLLELDDGKLLVVYYSPGGRQIKGALYTVTPSFQEER